MKFRLDNSFLGVILTPAINIEDVFTLEKEFFKLLFGAKINPPKNKSTVRS